MDLLAQSICSHIVGNPPVAYTLSTCPKCWGTGYYGGFSILPSGDLEQLPPADSLVQSIRKILTENIRPSGYGFNQSLLTGVLDVSRLQAVKNEVVRCLNYLKFIQNQESSRGFQYNPQERIDKISNVNVIKNLQDPRRVNVTVTVITLSSVKVSTPSITLGVTNG